MMLSSGTSSFDMGPSSAASGVLFFPGLPLSRGSGERREFSTKIAAFLLSFDSITGTGQIVFIDTKLRVWVLCVEVRPLLHLSHTWGRQVGTWRVYFS